MVLFCDFETFLVPVEDLPSGIFCLRVAQDPKYTEDIFIYSGPYVMNVFFNHLKEKEKFV